MNSDNEKNLPKVHHDGESSSSSSHPATTENTIPASGKTPSLPKNRSWATAARSWWSSSSIRRTTQDESTTTSTKDTSHTTSPASSVASNTTEAVQDTPESMVTTTDAALLRETLWTEAQSCHPDILQRRPGTLQVFFFLHRTEEFSWTLPWQLKQTETGHWIVERVLGLLAQVENPSTLPFDKDDDWSRSALVQPGDVLEQLHDWNCRHRTMEQIEEYYQSLVTFQNNQECISVTFTVPPEHGGHSDLRQVVVFSSSSSRNDNHTKEETTIDSNQSQSTIRNQETPTTEASQTHDDSKETAHEDTARTIQLPGIMDVVLKQSLLQQEATLQIQSVSNHGCCLKRNDVVVALGSTLCTPLSTDDAVLVWQSTQTRMRSIVGLRLPPTNGWNLRKAAVAVGGGSLMGVGAVLMVTPLHPIGHAMALGGVGVLGTEFEAPQRAWQAAHDKVVRTWSGNKKPPQSSQENSEDPINQQEEQANPNTTTGSELENDKDYESKKQEADGLGTSPAPVVETKYTMVGGSS